LKKLVRKQILDNDPESEKKGWWFKPMEITKKRCPNFRNDKTKKH
jgi:hypothetical protein